MNMTCTRRRWIDTLLSASAGLAFSRTALAQLAADSAPGVTTVPERHIELFNTHTRETVNVVFKRGDQYQDDALAALRNVLRDHRNGQSHDMDAGLFDQLFDLALAAQCEPRYEIISGYRSPESNDEMSSRPGSGVAKKSLHMQGRAMDVRLKNCTCEKLRDLALAAAKGGVGYYQRSNFVHIDTGAFRTWVG
jgi:uncharacterized protein YcbK (DUF882 family)